MLFLFINSVFPSGVCRTIIHIIVLLSSRSLEECFSLAKCRTKCQLIKSRAASTINERSRAYELTSTFLACKDKGVPDIERVSIRNRQTVKIFFVPVDHVGSLSAVHATVWLLFVARERCSRERSLFTLLFQPSNGLSVFLLAETGLDRHFPLPRLLVSSLLESKFVVSLCP